MITCALASVTADHKLPWLGTSRTRLGILVTRGCPASTERLRAVAYGQVKSTYTLGLPGPVAAFNFKDTRAGWTAGAGIEGAFGGGWSAKLEYLYVDLGNNTSSFTVGPTVISAIDSQVTDNIVRAGLNYNWGGGRYIRVRSFSGLRRGLGAWRRGPFWYLNSNSFVRDCDDATAA